MKYRLGVIIGLSLNRPVSLVSMIFQIINSAKNRSNNMGTRHRNILLSKSYNID